MTIFTSILLFVCATETHDNTLKKLLDAGSVNEDEGGLVTESWYQSDMQYAE